MSDKPVLIFLDGTHITGKPDNISPDGSPGGASGSGSNWSFGFGTGGGSGSFSGGFGGSSRKKAKKRARARKRAAEQKRAEAEAQARAEADAQAQAAQAAAHARLLQILSEAYLSRRSEQGQIYASKLSALASLLEEEIRAEKKAPGSPGQERWQLYLISKEKSELQALATRKETEWRHQLSLANVFDGGDPLAGELQHYQERLAQHSGGHPELLEAAHSKWESAYTAAQDARLLAESLRILNEKKQALDAQYLAKEKLLREVEEMHEAFRKHAERRQEQIKFKGRADEASRRDLVNAANRFHASTPSMVAGALIWSKGGTLVAKDAAVALEQSIHKALRELARIAAIRAGQILSVSLSAILYSPQVGNGELTPEQRRRLFQGISIGAAELGVASDQDLRGQSTADVVARIRALPVEGGTELRGIATGDAVPTAVPVVAAVFDSLSDTYTAKTSGPLPKQLVFDASAPAPASPASGESSAQPGVFIRQQDLPSQVSEIPAGVDLRFDDCIVCFPPESGLAPRYFSFAIPSPGAGIVVGMGEAASPDWWTLVSEARAVAMPAQIGESLRYREFSSVEAFDNKGWRVIAENAVLGVQLDEVNRRRMARGFAPYAPKASWVGERREFELRNREAVNDAGLFFDLDRLIITRPNSAQGARRLTPTFAPWPISNGATWTPLVPPGSESLGPTDLPAEPGRPALYPGGTTEPAGSQNESNPSANPDDINANIPGYGDDDDLPSSGVVIAGPPVEPLEVGPYNGLSRRSRLDGLDIDHIVSQGALRKHITDKYGGDVEPHEIYKAVQNAPSIAIPAHVHKEYSETYGGRNSKEKQNLDASDLKAAVNSNLDALKPGLLEEGFSEAEVEVAREKLHQLNFEQGWYK